MGHASSSQGLKPTSTIAMFAGLRATGNASSPNRSIYYDHDFIIEIPDRPRGLVNLGGIESPGLTSSPAIAQRVVELMVNEGEKLLAKRDWNPIRPPRIHFRKLPLAEQKKLIKADPRYGRVVCRCEMVTEGEIIAEIHAPIPAVTYDAIKRRTWLGTGRCLGSFRYAAGGGYPGPRTGHSTGAGQQARQRVRIPVPSDQGSGGAA